MLGLGEFLIILFIVLVLFGRNLPDVGAGLGKAVRNFRKAVRQPDEIDITPKEKEEENKSQNGEP